MYEGTLWGGTHKLAAPGGGFWPRPADNETVRYETVPRPAHTVQSDCSDPARPPMPPPQATDSSNRAPTAERILDHAQERIQRRGYNAVSYGDLADDLDLTTAAIHYHFPSKGDLGQALVARYRQASAQKRQAICETTAGLHDCLSQYATLYADMLKTGGICLSGVLAADASTLPEGVQQEVQAFFHDQEDWLTEVIAADTTGGAALKGCTTARDAAQLFLAVLQGGMLTTPERDADAYTQRVQAFIDSLVP